MLLSPTGLVAEELNATAVGQPLSHTALTAHVPRKALQEAPFDIIIATRATGVTFILQTFNRAPQSKPARKDLESRRDREQRRPGLLR